ncbi:MAG: ABC transporter ATP-binding protein [Saprospiraceae bacterium]
MNQDQTFTQQKALWPFLKRMFTYAWKHKQHVKKFMSWIVLIAIIDASFPIALKMMIDNALTPELQNIKNAADNNIAYIPDFSDVYLYASVFLIMAIVSAIGIYWFILHTGKVHEYVITDLRQTLFEKLQKMPFSYYDKTASGWLLSRITSDTDRVSEVVAWGLIEVLWGSVMIVFCLLSLSYFSWQLALIVGLSIPLMLIVSIKVRMLVLKYARKSRKLNSEITASFTEHINGVAVIKSMAQEKKVSEQFNVLSGKMRNSSYKAAYFTAMYFPIIVLIGGLAAAAVVFYGSKLAIALPAIITVGILAAAFDYTLKIFFPIIDVSMFYAKAQDSLSAGERIFSLLDEPITIKNTENVTDFEPIKGDIEYRNVEFYYNKNHPVLPNFNLKIKAGESIALVGATGEGKTTIANLVPRLYEPVNGQILIDNQDYKTKTIQSLRQQVGMVLQTPHLFSGTIEENIRFGKLNSTKTEIEQALALVGATNFIPRLQEEVGENGENLSMGERQLIAFARAIIANPRIFIMDEATANIDTITEVKIQKGIAKMLEGRTSIIIAHRLSTIKNCDRILVIQKGGILESGSHQTLMQKGGKYHELYTKQLRTEQVTTV